MSSYEYYEKDFNKRTESNHEKETREELLSRALELPKGSLIIDAGAYNGDTCIKLAKQLKDNGRQDIKMVAVEPDSTKCKFMKNKAKEMGIDLEIHKAGCWDKKQRGKIVQEMDSSSWRVEADPKGDIQFDTIDNIIGDRPVGIIKIDVEGSEPEAIKGASKVMKRDKPVVIAETNSKKRFLKEHKAARDLMKKKGYRLIKDMGLDHLYLPETPKEKARGVYTRKGPISWKSVLAAIFLVLSLATFWGFLNRFTFVAKNRRPVAAVFFLLFVVFILIHLLTGPEQDQEKAHGEEPCFNDMVKERMANFPPELIDYVDKLKIKEIVKSKGYSGVPSADIETDTSLVLKPNNSTAKYVVIEDGKVTVSMGTNNLVSKGDSINKVKQVLPRLNEQWSKARMNQKEDFYNKIPYDLVTEKLLKNKDDYKFHATDGKIHLVQVHYDRDGNQHEMVFLDENYKPSKNEIKPTLKSKTGKAKRKPRNWDKMVQAAKDLSKGMDYVRIDMYEEGPYIGEFTFTPNAGGSNVKPKSFDVELARNFFKI